MPQQQDYAHHAKFDPPFHFFLAPLSLIFVILTAVYAFRNPSIENFLHIVVALWAMVAVFKTRIYALKVQDRVIRLEERLRLKELAPANFQARIGELSEDQLIGLRFASDAEVADLAKKALDEKLDRKQIKQAVKNWRPDFWRV